MTATEYVEGLNDLVAITAPDLEASFAAYQQIEDPTMAEWVAFVDREIAIRRAFVDGFEALDPPDSVVEVHRILNDAMARGVAATEGLAAVAERVSSPEEAEQTPEFAEYHAANADGPRICFDVLAKLDDLAASGEAFADVAWIPDLGLAVRAALPCDEIENF